MKLIEGSIVTYEDTIQVEYTCGITGEIVELEVDYPSLYKLIQVESVQDIKVWHKDSWKFIISAKEDYFQNTHAEVRIANIIRGSNDNGDV